MRAYKLMAEAAKVPKHFLKYVDPANPHWIHAPEADRTEFWKRFESARIFVFDEQAWPIPDKVDATDEPDLELPFQCSFFENLAQRDGKPWLVSAQGKAFFAGALIYEISPTRYDLYFLGHFEGSAAGFKVLMFNWEPGCGNTMAWVSRIWLDRLRHSVFGVEHVDEKIKIGSGTGQKHVHRIRHIVRIVPRATKETAGAAFSREIDWTHRWAVRGHWRRHEGLGKNRAGEYSVEGFTWITEHVRGPEDAPLIEKVRFVAGVRP